LAHGIEWVYQDCCAVFVHGFYVCIKNQSRIGHLDRSHAGASGVSISACSEPIPICVGAVGRVTPLLDDRQEHGPR
jgi:hypothetical protein